ncbi:pectin lyase [Paenibacillus sp. FSL H8-0548]|uniref:right-handed parallel beta-helix repeat-containing protein n=1 Tax=Paenibacillus sp. FSL H8-0548 TaxID=1920422 RepID=UPI00096EF6F4|nr:right-handed parallel beta-helix repeat-containing protein [Paenibacillus sp. FSL H8-0548]OMF35938.1 pectin lyase [Paenibacillus sp. FSL H8-0548]
MNEQTSYRIELDRFNISNIGLNAVEATKGINNAISWAKSAGYLHVILPKGSYSVSLDPSSLVAIQMQSGIHFELEDGCTIKLVGTSSPSYSIIEMRGLTNSKISGGRLVGDKQEHIYEIAVKFVRGGVNADGTLNNDPNWIRSEVVDRYANPGLLAYFRLWSIPGVNAAGYHFYQYKDTISKQTLTGSRTDGLFAPASSTGRGWFLNEEKDFSKNNKMIFTIPLAAPLTDSQIASIQAKVDNSFYTHESGYGIGSFGSNHIEIFNIEISDCIGDGIITGYENYLIDPAAYTQEQMGQHILIHDCHIHHCRRQGISICASNDTHVYRNKIHHIGYAEDGVTTNFRNGTPPMFGIDIESMYMETNIPYKTADRPNGIELNYRIYIKDNHIYSNARGHLVNADGSNVSIDGNTFEGTNVGGVSSYANFPNVKFTNNTFKGCELWVQGDNFVNGAVIQNGNLRLLDVRGAVVQNIQIKDGLFYGSSIYGYFGTPVVNTSTSTFTFKTAHGMGNGAKVSFEQWIGKVPTGISVDKLYYTINVTSVSFQVSETLGGAPVAIKDAGVAGFNIGRYNYGRCYIYNVSVERDWRPDNASTPNFNIIAAGAVIKNVTVKNYDAAVVVPQNYAGRPNLVEGMTVIEGSVRFEGSHVSDSEFIRAKTPLLGNSDIQLGSNNAEYTRQVTMRNSLLQSIGLMMEGNSLVTGSTFVNASIGKADNDNKAIIAQSYMDNTKLNFHWLRKNNSVTVAKSVFKGAAITGTAPFVRLIDNTDLGNT